MKRVAILLVLLLLAGCTPAPNAGIPAPSAPGTTTPVPPVPGGSAPAPPAPGQLTGSPAAFATFRMIDANAGWAIGGGAVLVTEDGGMHWKNVAPPGITIPDTSGAPFNTGCFLDSKVAWITFGYGTGPITILRTGDGGNSWATTRGPKIVDRASLVFADARHGWMFAHQGAAMGSEGVELYTTADGGAQWTLVNKAANSPQGPAPAGSIPFGGLKTGIAFRDASTGWITGLTYAMGQVWLERTTDGGQTWRHQALPVPARFAGHTIQTYPPVFFSEREGILPAAFDGGGYETIFFRTEDGGATWQATAPVKAAPRPSGSLTASFADPSHGWTTDGTTLYRTADGGKTWATLAPRTSLAGVRELQFVTDQVGWALPGEGKTPLLKTTDGGDTWTGVGGS